MSDKAPRKLPPRLYAWLFRVWHWYALKVLKIPFILTYQPDDRILGMTYSWTPDYAHRVKNGFDAEDKIRQLEQSLKEANTTISDLIANGAKKDGDKRL